MAGAAGEIAGALIVLKERATVACDIRKAGAALEKLVRFAGATPGCACAVEAWCQGAVIYYLLLLTTSASF